MEKKQKHEQLIYLFWRLFLHFCECISTLLDLFKAVKQMFIVFLMKLCIFNNFELLTFYHVQGQTHVLLKLVILRLNKQTKVYLNAILSFINLLMSKVLIW